MNIIMVLTAVNGYLFSIWTKLTFNHSRSAPACLKLLDLSALVSVVHNGHLLHWFNLYISVL